MSCKSTIEVPLRKKDLTVLDMGSPQTQTLEKLTSKRFYSPFLLFSV